MDYSTKSGFKIIGGTFDKVNRRASIEFVRLFDLPYADVMPLIGGQKLQVWINWGLWFQDKQCCREITNDDGSFTNATFYDDEDKKVKGMRTYLDSS